MSLLQPIMLFALPLIALPIIIPPDQSAALSNNALGGDAIFADRKQDAKRLREDSTVVDFGLSDARRCGVDLCRLPPAREWISRHV